MSAVHDRPIIIAIIQMVFFFMVAKIITFTKTTKDYVKHLTFVLTSLTLKVIYNCLF